MILPLNDLWFNPFWNVSIFNELAKTKLASKSKIGFWMLFSSENKRRALDFLLSLRLSRHTHNDKG